MINIEDIANNEELFDGHYKLLRPLSTDGATADVWLAIDTNTIDADYNEEGSTINGNADETGMLVAIKIYKPKNALDIEGEQRFRDEYKIVYECRHENLLQPTSFAIYKDIPYLVLPYCKNGSSEQLIGKKQTEDEIWKFISDVASGLAKLHSNQPQIIHQDIKPANILIDNNGNFAITDFGISSSAKGSHSSYYDEENSGTLAYMAPERFSENPQPSPESDIWAFGATLCEILTGNVPFGEDGGKGQNENTPIYALSGLPSSIKNLIHACLQKDPKKRPTARQIVQSSQLKQYPLKRKAPIVITITLLVCILAAGAVYFLMSQKTEPLAVSSSTEEVFQTALRQMNMDDRDSLLVGIRVMESLGNAKYIPAMYEMAFTYGWFTDSLSIQRKEFLDIETDTNHFPKKQSDVDKAKVWFDKILETQDSTDAVAFIKAQAAFRLGTYYCDKRFQKIIVENEENYNIALDYYDTAAKWASRIKGKDNTMLKNNISRGKEVAQGRLAKLESQKHK